MDHKFSRRCNSLTQSDHVVGVAVMREFGIAALSPDQVGIPNSNHLVNCLRNLHDDLKDAVDAGDLGAIVNAADRLNRLRQALEVWEWVAELSIRDLLAWRRTLPAPTSSEG